MTTPHDPIRPLDIHEDEISFYQNEGYLLLPNIIEPEVVETLRDETLKVLKAVGSDLDGKKLVQSQEYVSGSVMDSLVNSERIRRIASTLMVGESSLYMPFTAVKSCSGGGSFEFHQDNQYTRHDGPAVNMWFALQEMTPENGCLRIAPRTHLDGTLESRDSADADGHRRVLEDPKNQYLARMRPGDCLAFTRLTVHGSGPNTSDDHRVGYALQFHRNDSKAFFDDKWELLTVRPRFTNQPSASYEEIAGRV